MSSNTCTAEGQKDSLLRDSCFPADSDLLVERGGGDQLEVSHHFTLILLMCYLFKVTFFFRSGCKFVRVMPQCEYREITDVIFCFYLFSQKHQQPV